MFYGRAYDCLFFPHVYKSHKSIDSSTAWLIINRVVSNWNTSITCMTGNYMYLNYMYHKCRTQFSTNSRTRTRSNLVFFAKIQNLTFFFFFTSWRLVWNIRSECRTYSFLKSCCGLNGLFCGIFFRHWRKTWKSWEIFNFLYKFFRFFFTFRSEFRIYLVFHSCFGFNAYFMWNFPAKLKKKLDLFQKVSKKSPNFFLILLEPRSL